jgi:hypothetical protein
MRLKTNNLKTTATAATAISLASILASGDSAIVFGGAVKALGDGKYRAPLVTFSTSADPDLTKDYFTKSTDFWREFPSEITTIYSHAQDPTMKSAKIGENGKAALSVDDAGVWMEGQLNLADQYEAAIYSMIEAGKMGTSSGSAPHLVERVESNVKGVYEIKSWPLVEASLTPCPAEPRNRVVPLKSLKSSLLGSFGSYWYGDSWYDPDTDDFDPAQEMTCAAASRLHDRLCTAVGNIIRAEGLDNAAKLEALQGVTSEYSTLLMKAAEALLAALPAEEDGGDADDAADVLKALMGRSAIRPATVKDFERFLRDAGGYSRQEAKQIVSDGIKSLLRDAESPNDALKQQLVKESLLLDSRRLTLKTVAMAGVNQ